MSLAEMYEKARMSVSWFTHTQTNLLAKLASWNRAINLNGLHVRVTIIINVAEPQLQLGVRDWAAKITKLNKS